MRTLPCLTIVAAATVALFRLPSPPTRACSVVVRETQADIAFPRVERSEWVWNRPPQEAAHNVPNYWWSLYLYPGSGLHVEVSRGARGPAKRGDLLTMLRSSKLYTSWPSPGSGEFDAFKEISSLRPTVENGRVVLHVRDTALLRELFRSNHPTNARCDFHADGEEDPAQVWDTVTYADKR